MIQEWSPRAVGSGGDGVLGSHACTTLKQGEAGGGGVHFVPPRSLPPCARAEDNLETAHPASAQSQEASLPERAEPLGYQ